MHKELFTTIQVVTNDLWTLYEAMWPYQRAVVQLDYLDFLPKITNKEEILTNNYSPNYLLFKMFKLLKYKQILVCLDRLKINNSKQVIKQVDRDIKYLFNDEERSIEFQKNVFGLQNPEVKVVTQLSTEVVSQFFHQKDNIENINSQEVECIVVKTIGVYHIMKVLQGQIYEGQLLYSLQSRAFISSIQINNEGQIMVKFEQDQMLEGILCSHQYNPEILKKICVEVQLCEIPVYAAKDAFRKMGQVSLVQFNQTFVLPNSRANPIESYGQLNSKGDYQRLEQSTNFNLIKIEFQIDGKKFLNIKQQPLLFFKNQGNEILFYGRISSISEKLARNTEQAPYFLIPKFQIQNQNLLFEGQDLRYICRICKKAKISRVIQDCGHLRYCGECIEFCLDAKECYYCSQKITKVLPIKIFYVDAEQYQQVRQKKLAQKSVEITEVLQQNKLSSFSQIVTTILKEGNLDFNSFYCSVCDEQIGERFCVCESDHMSLLCNKCNAKECSICKKQILVIQNVKYSFIDDECQI